MVEVLRGDAPQPVAMAVVEPVSGGGTCRTGPVPSREDSAAPWRSVASMGGVGGQGIP